MIASMTGFARHDTEAQGQSLVWEIRSVNHRYLDLRVQLPDALRALETDVRARLQQSLGRGKVDAVLRLESPGEDAVVRFDPVRAKALVKTIREIDQLMVNGARVSALDILTWPGIIQRDAALDADVLRTAVLEALDGAIADLRAMRAAEGEALRQTLETRLDAYSGLIRQLRERRTAIVEEQRERLRARIAELDLTLDPQRLEQEVALLAQRLDVDEELDRLDGHVAAMRDILDRDEPVGRRLDFLMQEFNREANTLGSKSHDLETTRVAMEMKVLTEQMREQVQNIE
ncbi:YicC/YloC family endoribonuclease [Thioalkalivibrio sp.]|uniref:YicC/YloC family endoribonuclease n=1 Tax=Thioalkalivibrio sp. TaxID=2093813 RepID=UPI0012D4F440|nr:YicC/YloC family endoribonuclease [Thioalkalivibrio sp.]TVP76867.1 MAG: YicC family protein [Thioalkalivibrio sp.]